MPLTDNLANQSDYEKRGAVYRLKRRSRSGRPIDSIPYNDSQQVKRMILGIGVDLIDCRRLQRELSERPWMSTDTIFTAAEIRSCGCGKRGAAFLAACFAAKEAVLKALGVDVTNLGLFRQVELVHKPGREPAIMLHPRAKSLAQSLGVRHVWISIASAKEHAGAFVVMES